jgi:exopolyphosphatase/guanosine-5'-triphosphate,3'-diphosphate pyrophosphatase
VGELRGSDLSLVAEQLGREPTIPFTVVARCPGGHPLVIRNAPLDAEGRPFPTLYWLTCPHAGRKVSRLESEGAIGRLNERRETDPAFAEAIDRAHRAYAAERDGDRRGAGSRGGVGGTRVGLKCLHAHYAHHLAGGDDEVGAWVAAQVEPIHAERQGRVAAIDQGTNTTRLLVGEPDGAGGFEDLARDMVITRLGEGVDRTGVIAPSSLERTLAVIGTFARRARALHAERIRVGATAAVRDASNRTELERRVRELTGSDVEVISGPTEGELSFLGATGGLDALGVPGPYLVLDIGGGSTELAIGGAVPEASVSTQMGSVRLTERFVRRDPPPPAELEAARAEIVRVLDEARASVPVERARTLVAVSGTSTTVQAISLGLPFYDPERIHRTRIERDEVRRVLARLAGMTTAERAAVPVMAPGRADVIVQGALILVTAMERLGFGDALVSETDILDGLVLQMLAGTDMSAPPTVR